MTKATGQPPGRRPLFDRPLLPLTVRLPHDLAQQAQDLAAERGVPTGEVLRQIVTEALTSKP